MKKRRKRVKMKVVVEGGYMSNYYGLCTTYTTRSLKGAHNKVNELENRLEKEGVDVCSVTKAW